MLVIFLSTLSIIFVFSTMSLLEYDEFEVVRTLYAQSSNLNNKTTLPIPELEPVQPEADNTTKYLPYEDSDLGFTMNYPSDWRIDKENTASYTVAGFESPNETANVDVRVFPSGDYESIKEYGDKTFKESKDSTLLAYYRNSTTLLSGKLALKAIYLSTDFGSTSKLMMVATLIPEKNSIYAIVYYSNPQNFNNSRPVVEKMIDSFKISGKGPIIQEDNSSATSP